MINPPAARMPAAGSGTLTVRIITLPPPSSARVPSVNVRVHSGSKALSQ
jgi:hypothetical protein